MDTIKVEEHLSLAEKTGAFTPREIEVLREVLEDSFGKKDSHYIFLDEKQGDVLQGYIIFGRTPLTDCGWDAYWLAVAAKAQKKGIGMRLLQRMQQYTCQSGSKAVIRIETAGKKEYAYVRSFYIKAGFEEAGRIPDFYTDGDDLVIFRKTITAFA
ncbi:MAG: GNAT family N-acetyltransferase [Pseudomonadota bacterium]